MNLAEIALRDRDCELLDLLLSLDSEVFRSQLRSVKNRQSMSTRFINTQDFDIWIVLANSATVFNHH